MFEFHGSALVEFELYNQGLSAGQKIGQDKQDEQDYFVFHHGKS